MADRSAATGSPGKRSARRAASAVVAVILLWSTAATAEEIRGQARVLAGDTFEIKGEVVGLFGVASPRRDERCLAGSLPWLCGAAALQHAEKLIAGQEVVCRIHGIDRELKRKLGGCLAGGRDLALLMVSAGWAAADPKDGGAYLSAQAKARAAATGIWQGRR